MERMNSISNWDKFKLLLWKNWVLQWNHKTQFIIELLLPAVFTLLLVFFRTLVEPKEMSTVYYPPVPIDNLDLLNENLQIHQLPQPLNMSLLYSPKNGILEEIVRDAALLLGDLEYEGFESAVELESNLLKRNALVGIEFKQEWSNLDTIPLKFLFALRMPSELRTSLKNMQLTWTTMKLFLPFETTGPRNIKDVDGGIPVGYLREGFLPVQHALSIAYIKQVNKENKDLPNIVMQRYPYPSFVLDPLLQAVSSIISLFIILSFLYPSTCIVKYITVEKEKQLKEVMKIMGLHNWIHWTAWFVKSFIMLGISVILVVLLIKIKWKSNVSVLTYTDWTVFMFFMFVFVLSTISFSFMMSTFFSKASTASVVTGLVWFVSYLPFISSIQVYDQLSLGGKLAWCFSLNTAVGFAFKVILGHEGNGEGLQWSNLFSPINVDDDLTLGYIILIMLCSSVIYMLICLYVEQVFPGNYGVPRKWNFPFTKEFWSGKKKYYIEKETSEISYKNPDAFEAIPSRKHCGIHVKKLRKVFGDRVAVKDLSIKMCQDEITVLLGHNGAGKTTTISMLTGMFPPTSGTAIINGCDIRTDIDGARTSLGICPQHNILFDDLSVANHLVFFCRLKGLKGDAIDVEINKYLTMINLDKKRNVLSKNLSGGMKRKLSLCCALCGGNKVVLCDEPSSGLDPSARRQLWDLLQAEKVGRTILLTTHFMDEADVLGDRIAIMCAGELKCHGTSFFLKKRFGFGYKLICVKNQDCDSDKILELLRNHIPDLELASDIGTELTYHLPDSYSSIFEKMLKDLEMNSEKLMLSGYGISITSLEDVFMRIGAETTDEDDIRISHLTVNNSLSRIRRSGGEDEPQDDQLFFDNSKLLQGCRLIRNQWEAMLLKKFYYSYRNALLFLVQNLVPVFFIIFTIMSSMSSGTSNELKPMQFSLKQYPAATTVLEGLPCSDNDKLTCDIAESYKNIAMSYGHDYNFESTNGQNFTKYILMLGETIQVRINSKYLAAATIKKGEITAWLNNQPLHTAPLTVNLIHNAILKAITNESYDISVINAPLPYSAQTVLSQLSVGGGLGTQMTTNICFSFCFVTAIYILFPIKERASRSKLLQIVGGVRIWIFWLSQLVWDFLTFSFTAFISIVTIACFQEKGYSTFDELSRYFLVFILFGCSVLPLTYLLSFFYTEPATGLVRVSIINVFLGLILFFVVTVMSFEIFDTKNAADIMTWIFRLFPHFTFAKSLNKLYMNGATRRTCEDNRFIVTLSSSLTCQFLPKCCNLKSYFGTADPGIFPEISFFIATSIVYFTILLLVEYGIFNLIAHLIQMRTVKDVQSTQSDYYDNDVEEVKHHVKMLTMEELQSLNLVLDSVTKYYGKFLAVNQISLYVKPMECFGLLGINGAGKTTTFKMLTGDEPITFGAAYVRGISLQSNMNKIYSQIGYCPQFDALLDDISGRETLYIFALIRGIPKYYIESISMELAKSFGFVKHLDKRTITYSGGSKRKLSTALAVLGSPSVIYLDEPTSGMDPAARRKLWDMVCRIRDAGKSIILTSHSMEECEALCTTLAIMVNGEFKCIGAAQHLKNKFSKGLILKIKIKRAQFPQEWSARSSYTTLDTALSGISLNDMNNVKEFVQKQFPESALKEEYQGMLTYYIPIASIRWSEIFGIMEQNRNNLNIEDYSISQTTLEEIFLEFAKHQT